MKLTVPPRSGILAAVFTLALVVMLGSIAEARGSRGGGGRGGGFSRGGLPIGLQIIGPRLGEAPVLALAHAYEQATDWHRREPPLA